MRLGGSRRVTVSLRAVPWIVVWFVLAICFSCSVANAQTPIAVAANAPPPTTRVDEHVVEFEVDGQKIVGTLALPVGVKSPPVILILHGFAPLRDGLPIKGTHEGFFSRPARLWAERGFASLRISTRGAGGSDGALEDMTFETRISETLAALSWLSQQPNVDHNRIGIVGYNQGAVMAAAAAGRRGGGAACGGASGEIRRPLAAHRQSDLPVYGATGRGDIRARPRESQRRACRREDSLWDDQAFEAGLL
jgi:dienelactone hydrolase